MMNNPFERTENEHAGTVAGKSWLSDCYICNFKYSTNVYSRNWWCVREWIIHVSVRNYCVKTCKHDFERDDEPIEMLWILKLSSLHENIMNDHIIFIWKKTAQEWIQDSFRFSWIGEKKHLSAASCGTRFSVCFLCQRIWYKCVMVWPARTVWMSSVVGQ